MLHGLPTLLQPISLKTLKNTEKFTPICTKKHQKLAAEQLAPVLQGNESE